MDNMQGENYAAIVKKQLLINISEILAKQDLLTEEEKNRMKIILSTE